MAMTISTRVPRQSLLFHYDDAAFTFFLKMKERHFELRQADGFSPPDGAGGQSSFDYRHDGKQR